VLTTHPPLSPHGLFVGSAAVAEGDVSYGALRSNLFRRVLHDVYTLPEQVVTHETLCHAAAMIVPTTAMVTGRSAAVLYGVPLATSSDAVEICVPEKFRFGPMRGIRLHRALIKPHEWVDWEGIRLATPVRTALDLLLRQAPRTATLTRRLRVAVSDLDQLVRAGLVRTEDIAIALRGRRDWGVTLARQAVGLVDPRAESPRESELRVILQLAGMPATPQYPVIYRGTFLGRLDLAYPEHRVAVEYDGQWHNEPAQALADQQRRELMRDVGWRFIIVTGDDLAGDPAAIVDLVSAALREGNGGDFSPLKSGL
jgi:hypothetical protein